MLENKGLKESYELWQVGFYAEDPEEGEILFCIAQASQSKNIPSEAKSPGFSITWDFYFNISNTVPFEVKLNSAGLVNIESYEVHTKAINDVNEKVNCLNADLESSSIRLVGKAGYSIGDSIEIPYSDKNRIVLIFYTWNTNNSFIYTPMLTTIIGGVSSTSVKSVYKYDGTQVTSGKIDIQLVLIPA